MPRASVLIPIHNKATTLPLTVDTVLRQSVTDVEVLLIGDGVTEDVRRVAEDLVALDARVRFLDLPKGPHHGERHRHTAVEAAESDAIFYLCDDDLLLPDHVADLLDLLADHDLVQSLNGYLTADGRVRLYAADLADPDDVALHLDDDVEHNAISITGTAHTRAAYDRVTPWDTTPAGWWPDRWQFRKMLGFGFRAATSARMTALQFPTSADGRDTWTDDERAAEVVPWHALVTGPGAQDEIDRRVRASLLPQLVEERGQLARLHAALASQRAYQDDVVRAREAEAADLRSEVETLRTHVDRLVEIRAAQEQQLAKLRERLAHKDEVLAQLRAKVRRPPQT
ncbi:putative coiled-coil protein SlyX [Nocardioides sp. BE266]|uniref:glycosyltransferase n=1 Tax=Nocardioides sp. BE266 TaxID=2817725 RepID=UPI002866563F|nr:glycosyltransferase [Nocardioides sp. BE266]MDR7253414.1 putative coiled-coil protein SlyX [Nocardioides sp. BE266]